MIENNKDNSIYDSPKFLPFTDDRIFMNVMRSPKICRALLELILPNEEIGAIRIKKSDNPFVDNSEIDEEANESMDESDSSDKDSEQTDSLENLSVETQKTLKLEADAHGVRFDAFVESSKLWADIEMQTDNDSKIDKRARYYHANMDLDFLEQGQPYENLKPSYVIFICTFDHFNMDEPVYFFRSWDVEKSLPLKDLSYTIMLNTKCSPEKVPKALKPFYEYLNDPKKNQASELTRMIDERVRKFNSNEWRKRYMTFEYILNERGRESEAIGFEKGAAQKQREIAKNLKQAGIPVEVIAENTGLSAEEVEAL
jgi:predicted transposase/invertase (TIGR01784 family)